jgi:hypothetical protein
MNKIVLTPELSKLFRNVERPPDIRNAEGELVGFYYPWPYIPPDQKPDEPVIKDVDPKRDD